ncbi:MAG: hypothetical protein VKS61_17505 [Candidatus Sericytochromatia bacterium]|nr:hypothetical protein [Candidatus Sericytochromatia bacterium]
MKKALLPLGLLAGTTLAGCALWAGTTPQPGADVRLKVSVAPLPAAYSLQQLAAPCISEARGENGVATDIVDVDTVASFTKAGLVRVDFYAKKTGTNDTPVMIVSVLNNGDLDSPVALRLTPETNFDITWRAFHPKDASPSAPSVLVEAQHNGGTVNGLAEASRTLQVTTPARGGTLTQNVTIHLANRCFSGKFGNGALTVQTNAAATPTVEHLPGN